MKYNTSSWWLIFNNFVFIIVFRYINLKKFKQDNFSPDWFYNSRSSKARMIFTSLFTEKYLWIKWIVKQMKRYRNYFLSPNLSKD